MESYTFEEHAHNYAVWTAARAVSRNFVGTVDVQIAIDSTDLRAFAMNDEPVTTVEFDQQHRVWCKQLMNSLQAKVESKATYGRAAKIIAIYLKTAVVLCNKGACQKSAVIHPPIDAILLNRLAEDLPMRRLSEVRWTQLDEAGYWELVDTLRTEVPYFDWRLEYYWKPAATKESGFPGFETD